MESSVCIYSHTTAALNAVHPARYNSLNCVYYNEPSLVVLLDTPCQNLKSFCIVRLLNGSEIFPGI